MPLETMDYDLKCSMMIFVVLLYHHSHSVRIPKNNPLHTSLVRREIFVVATNHTNHYCGSGDLVVRTMKHNCDSILL